MQAPCVLRVSHRRLAESDPHRWRVRAHRLLASGPLHRTPPPPLPKRTNHRRRDRRFLLLLLPPLQPAPLHKQLSALSKVRGAQARPRAGGHSEPCPPRQASSSSELCRRRQREGTAFVSTCLRHTPLVSGSSCVQSMNCDSCWRTATQKSPRCSGARFRYVNCRNSGFGICLM
jgi:hypothetical protein